MTLPRILKRAALLVFIASDGVTSGADLRNSHPFFPEPSLDGQREKDRKKKKEKKGKGNEKTEKGEEKGKNKDSWEPRDCYTRIHLKKVNPLRKEEKGLSQLAPYYGLRLGTFHTHSNGVKGDVYAVDSNTIFIKGFSYDGQSEDAVFWAGSTISPDDSGFIIPSDASTYGPLPAYHNQDILLRLPDGKGVQYIRWLAVRNRNSSKSLGTLVFSELILPPHPMAIGPLVNTKRGVSTGDILILDTQTFLVPDFNYDGSGKGAYWWLSKGTKPSQTGIRLQENGRDAPIQSSSNSTAVIMLPKGHSILDYDTLSVWNTNEGEDYGFVDVPKNLNIPPSPRTLTKQEFEMEEFNCEMLNDNLGLEVRWLIKGDDIIVHLIGNIGPSEYMALGLSKDDTETRFDSADAVVAGMDTDGRGYAVDYFFESSEKCANGHGMCPDSVHGSADNLDLLQAEKKGNSTIVVFKRQLRAADKVYDQNIYTDGPQAILWAVGPLFSDGFANTPTVQSRGNLLLDFGREPNWNCPPPKNSNSPSSYSKEKTDYIRCPSDRSFRAQIGTSPRSSVKKVWYINGLSTPELTVQRGNTYTFIIEGGLNSPVHHPFYITSSKEGGMFQNILEANVEPERTYAGIQQDPDTATIFPTAEGRLCDWTYSDADPEHSVLTSNDEVKPPLTLKCEPGQPGKLIWTPTSETPDVVYYQSFMERNLGGKIEVVDFCEEINPHRYLEVSIKGGKPKTVPTSTRKGNPGLERETEDNEFLFDSNVKNGDNTNVEESRESLKPDDVRENAHVEFLRNTFPPKFDKYTVTNNVINSFRITTDDINENNKPIDNNPPSENADVTIAPNIQVPKREIPFPHDESERSDVYVPQQGDLKKIVSHQTVPKNSHRTTDDLLHKRPVQSASEISSVPALITQPPQNFRPQFEGGFIPLVINPMKEKEFVQTKEFIYPPQLRRPHRPFLYNESVPFHGTFKPGVPDFSGFNISHYSQEDASIVIAHNQDSLPLLSASKPQPVHKPLPPIGSVPMHLLQRPIDPAHRPQRLRDIGLRYHQQNPSFAGSRKNILPHFPINGKTNFQIPNIRDGDLTGVSSQRVYVSLQASGDKKPNIGNIPNQHPSPYNRKHQNLPPNKIMYPPPIQRRPDFHDEREIAVNRQNIPQRKYIPQGIASSVNKPINQPKMNLPLLNSGGMQGQNNIRPQIPGSNIPFKSNLPRKPDQVIIPPNQMRQPFPFMQIPSRERVPQIPLPPKGFPVPPIPSTDEKVKMSDMFLNVPQNAADRIRFLTHVVNSNGKFPEKSQETLESQESDLSSSSKEQRPMPHLVNAELVEVPTKSMPQSFIDRQLMHSGVGVPKLNINGSINPLLATPNIRNSFSAPSVIQPNLNLKNLPLGTIADIPVPPHSIKITESSSESEEISFSEMKGEIPKFDSYETYIQNSDGNKSQMKIHNKESDLKQTVFVKPDIKPVDFGHHELKETVQDPEIYSSSNPIKTGESPIFLEYEHDSDDSQEHHGSDSALPPAEYLDYNIPFGARLKFPQNGSKVPVRSFSEIPKSPLDVLRKPQIYASNNRNRNPQGSIPSAQSSATSATTIISTTTSTTSTTTTTTEAPFLVAESVPEATSENKEEPFSQDKKDIFKTLYYTPPFSSLPIDTDSNNSSLKFNEHSILSDDVKHIPIIADTLEGIETKHLGRKNILPNTLNSSLPPLMIPPHISENINLPQISENLPSHDNGTDYSILNHILALIGGPPESKISEESS